MTEPAISVRNVSRKFGSSVAVEDLSFDVPYGSIFGLLGTNGAGKTTLMRMLVGHLHCDSGSVEVLGSDPWRHNSETRRRIAYVSDSMQLPPGMTLRSVLKMNRGLFPNWNAELAESLLKKLDVPADKRYSQLSLGQRRKAVLLQALAQGADLLILDEPAAGLDAIVRRHFLDSLLDAVLDSGQTVLFSSHMLSDIERVVDRVVMIAHGKLRMSGQLENLKAGLRRVRIAGEVNSDQLDSHFKVLGHRFEDDVTELLIDGFDQNEWDSVRQSIGHDASVEALNLEDMFVELNA